VVGMSEKELFVMERKRERWKKGKCAEHCNGFWAHIHPLPSPLLPLVYVNNNWLIKLIN